MGAIYRHGSKKFYGKLLFLLIITISLLSLMVSQRTYAIGFYSINERPAGLSYDDWVSRYLNWVLSIPTSKEKDLKSGAVTCLMNKTGSMVMLMQTTFGGELRQECDISSEDAIMIPLWIGWCDLGGDRDRIRDPQKNLDAQLSECARREYNTGDITSNVVVDGSSVVKLDVGLRKAAGSDPFANPEYRKTSVENVTEILSKGFNLKIPDDTHKGNLPPGTYRAGSHGWWVFLKPLPPGEHTISYNVLVTPEVPDAPEEGTNSLVTYNLRVT
jgi:hypothetical protein